MTDPIDYSRPVGWWCPVCTTTRDVFQACPSKWSGLCTRIPVYLPIPKGQRPPAASEVEDAEVCTGQRAAGAPCCYVSADAVFAPDNDWDAEIVHLAEYADADHINDIAQASARAHVEEAEVVTSYSAPSSSTPFTVVRSGNRAETVLDGMDLAATIQCIVTGATE